MFAKYKLFIDSVIKLKEKLIPKLESLVEYLTELEYYKDNSIVFTAINDGIILSINLLIGLAFFICLCVLGTGVTYFIVIP